MAAICYAPDGIHVVTKEGLTAGVKYSRKSIIDRPEQWSVEGKDRMPYGDGIYRFNESLVSNDSIEVYDVIPSFKSVKMLGGHYKGNGEVISHAITHSNPEFYRITISTDSVVVEYASERALKIAHRVLSTHNYLPGDGTPLPCAVIEDYPDLPYRAVMIDIARNFQRVNDLQTVVQMLARYRLNTLHFHFCDDEAWRLEIPGLPELTNVGSRRGYTLDEKNYSPTLSNVPNKKITLCRFLPAMVTPIQPKALPTDIFLVESSLNSYDIAKNMALMSSPKSNLPDMHVPLSNQWKHVIATPEMRHID